MAPLDRTRSQCEEEWQREGLWLHLACSLWNYCPEAFRRLVERLPPLMAGVVDSCGQVALHVAVIYANEPIDPENGRRKMMARMALRGLQKWVEQADRQAVQGAHSGSAAGAPNAANPVSAACPIASSPPIPVSSSAAATNAASAAAIGELSAARTDAAELSAARTSRIRPAWTPAPQLLPVEVDWLITIILSRCRAQSERVAGLPPLLIIDQASPIDGRHQQYHAALLAWMRTHGATHVDLASASGHGGAQQPASLTSAAGNQYDLGSENCTLLSLIRLWHGENQENAGRAGALDVDDSQEAPPAKRALLGDQADPAPSHNPCGFLRSPSSDIYHVTMIREPVSGKMAYAIPEADTQQHMRQPSIAATSYIPAPVDAVLRMQPYLVNAVDGYGFTPIFGVHAIRLPTDAVAAFRALYKITNLHQSLLSDWGNIFLCLLQRQHPDQDGVFRDMWRVALKENPALLRAVVQQSHYLPSVIRFCLDSPSGWRLYMPDSMWEVFELFAALTPLPSLARSWSAGHAEFGLLEPGTGLAALRITAAIAFARTVIGRPGLPSSSLFFLWLDLLPDDSGILTDCLRQALIENLQATAWLIAYWNVNTFVASEGSTQEDKHRRAASAMWRYQAFFNALRQLVDEGIYSGEDVFHFVQWCFPFTVYRSFQSDFLPGTDFALKYIWQLEDLLIDFCGGDIRNPAIVFSAESVNEIFQHDCAMLFYKAVSRWPAATCRMSEPPWVDVDRHSRAVPSILPLSKAVDFVFG